MDEQGKKKLLSRVPTRKLLASIKQDIRKTMKAAPIATKPKQK
jgi:hypothetical protein